MDKRIPFKSVLDQTSDIVIITEIIPLDKPGPKIIYVNQAFTALTGYTEQDVLGKTPRILQGEKTDKGTLEKIRSALEKKQSIHVELLNYAKDQSEYWLDFTIIPITDNKGNVIYFAAIEHDITQQKLIEEKLKHLAEHDALTGLINRPLFEDRLEQALSLAKRHQYGLAVCFIDLDNFKQINDNYGHTMGDLLLCAMVKRLQNCIRNSDILARFGGDEFGVILLNIDKDSVIKIAKKILQTCAREFLIENKMLHVLLSIGITLYPDDGSDLLIEKADAAMYYVKKHHKNNFKLFDEGIDFGA